MSLKYLHFLILGRTKFQRIGLFLYSIQCIENLSRTNCPVCLEDIHTSREPSQIPPCHHLIHKSCFAELTVKHNQLSCPVCKKSLYSEEALKPLWTFYDKEINFMPMTEMYQVSHWLNSSRLQGYILEIILSNRSFYLR